MAQRKASDESRLTPKGRATRDRIVQAAAELIVADGLAATSMERVRNTAAVSGSQLSHYFTDKNALIRAVIRRQSDIVLDFHRQPALNDLGSIADFERWIDLNMRYLRQIGTSGGTPTFHALAAQLAKSDDAVRATLADAYQSWIDVLRSAVQRLKKRNVLVSQANPRQIAMAIVGAHQGGGTLSFTYGAQWPHAEATRFAVNYLRLFAVEPAERRGPRTGRRRRRAAHSDGVDDAFPLTRKGLATQSRIVSAAAALMFERGAPNTSVEDVRTAAGVSGSQISHYFRDKRDLVRHVVAARRADVVAFHTQPKLGGLATLADLQAWAAACFDEVDTVYRKGGCVYGSLAGELIDSDDEVRGDLAVGYDEWLELFEAGLGAMRRRGDLHPEADPRHLAASLVASHQGGAMLTHVLGEAAPLRAAVGAALAYVESYAVAPRSARASKTRREARE
ncbi:TetR/AcrR family transcriptional regulator [Candidatus Mycobacterium wuenschmannii]|uniref:TetR/AcrR family transcriptional regulator n=1 Tax=Candidatus Mycobacterium wuenschmannii TaxID=3027808 RepID=A0ABY8VXA5_9MYCO|nr:TetR/AcrR family transcriptional regulator [Candidatus Mycobacterium wuenschmannii]WIM86154.1 TetR/AcrR family transcriptional regulator [Candidatus Mycobacterium wuenschmannii]